MTSIEDFVNERNSVLFSLDAYEIKAYMKKWGVPIPENNVVFWATVYKAICNIPGAPADKVKMAKEWLHRKGMSTEIGG